MFNNMVLSKEHPNVVYFPLNNLPPSKANELIVDFINMNNDLYPEYKIIYMAISKDQSDLVQKYKIQLKKTDDKVSVEYVEEEDEQDD